MTYYAHVTASRGCASVEDSCSAPLNSITSHSRLLPLDLAVQSRSSSRARQDRLSAVPGKMEGMAEVYGEGFHVMGTDEERPAWDSDRARHPIRGLPSPPEHEDAFLAALLELRYPYDMMHCGVRVRRANIGEARNIVHDAKRPIGPEVAVYWSACGQSWIGRSREETDNLAD